MIKRILKRLLRPQQDTGVVISYIESSKMLMGRMLANLNEERTEKILANIQKAEFKIFSQFGDDGIIQFLVNYLEIEEKTFIEFGVEDYSESNTRYLLMNNNWRGLVMDGSEELMQRTVNSDYYWRYELTAKPLFVTKENINQFILDNGYSGTIGLLHVDIDGNDYWIWKEINVIDPIIVIVEYNSVFGPDKPWTIPYDPKFYRTEKHFSNLYWGTSLLSLCDLASEKGYIFIGSNLAGNNAYFVKKEKAKNLIPLTSQQGYTLSRYRESRDINGVLTFITGEDRLKTIKNLEIFNTRENKIERI